MDLYGTWSVLCRLQNAVAVWAMQYINTKGARKVARYSIARLFQLATVAYEVQNGVLVELFELALPMVITEGHAQGHIQLDLYTDFDAAMDKDLLKEVTWLYAVVYELAYIGGWSIAEREGLSRLLRMYDVPQPATDDVEAMIKNADHAIAPLRRALEAMDELPYQNMTISVAATQLEMDALAAGQRWIRSHGGWKGGS